MIDNLNKKILKNDRGETRHNTGNKYERRETSREAIREEQVESKIEREVLPDAEKARREFEKARKDERELTAKEKGEAKEEKINIAKLDPKGKIDRLLYLAREKGLFFAVRVARDCDDPYILDSLHDILARDENYKKLL